jgi:serine/threonine protein kinase
MEFEYCREDFSPGKEIGSGSFSNVFEVTELSTGRLVALKVCSKAKLRKCQKQKAILTERVVWVRLNHPNIIKLYGTFQSRDSLCL